MMFVAFPGEAVEEPSSLRSILQTACARGKSVVPLAGVCPIGALNEPSTRPSACARLPRGDGGIDECFGYCHPKARGWPVDSITEVQRSPPGSTRRLSRVAIVMGTCTKRPCQRPISMAVLPAMAACTACRAMFQQ